MSDKIVTLNTKDYAIEWGVTCLICDKFYQMGKFCPMGIYYRNVSSPFICKECRERLKELLYKEET